MPASARTRGHPRPRLSRRRGSPGGHGRRPHLPHRRWRAHARPRRHRPRKRAAARLGCTVGPSGRDCAERLRERPVSRRRRPRGGGQRDVFATSRGGRASPALDAAPMLEPATPAASPSPARTPHSSSANPTASSPSTCAPSSSATPALASTRPAWPACRPSMSAASPPPRPRRTARRSATHALVIDAEGVMSRVNATAAGLGARPGLPPPYAASSRHCWSAGECRRDRVSELARLERVPGTARVRLVRFGERGRPERPGALVGWNPRRPRPVGAGARRAAHARASCAHRRLLGDPREFPAASARPRASACRSKAWASSSGSG